MLAFWLTIDCLIVTNPVVCPDPGDDRRSERSRGIHRGRGERDLQKLTIKSDEKWFRIIRSAATIRTPQLTQVGTRRRMTRYHEPTEEQKLNATKDNK